MPLGYQEEEVRVGFCQVADDRVSHDSVSVSRAQISAVLQQPVFFSVVLFEVFTLVL